MYTYISSNSNQFCRKGINIPTCQKRKQRLRKVKWLSQEHSWKEVELGFYSRHQSLLSFSFVININIFHLISYIKAKPNTHSHYIHEKSLLQSLVIALIVCKNYMKLLFLFLFRLIICRYLSHL